MRAGFILTALLLSLCLIGCSRSYSPKQMMVVADDISRIVPGALVNREFFGNSRARAYLGRFFAEAEFQPDRSAVAVVSFKAWREIFHSRPEVIGSRIQLDGRQITIVGVAEPHFAPRGAGELWTPKL